MALLQPQQQQDWFFLDFEDDGDGGLCEVEVDMVSSRFSLCPGLSRIQTSVFGRTQDEKFVDTIKLDTRTRPEA